QVASLSTRIGTWSRRPSSAPTCTPRSPGRLGPTRSTPVRSTRPAIPTPTAVMGCPVLPSTRRTPPAGGADLPQPAAPPAAAAPHGGQGVPAAAPPPGGGEALGHDHRVDPVVA